MPEPEPDCAREGCGHDPDQHGRRARRPARACLVPGCGCPEWADPIALRLDPHADPALRATWFDARDAVLAGDDERGYALMMAGVSRWLRATVAGRA